MKIRQFPYSWDIYARHLTSVRIHLAEQCSNMSYKEWSITSFSEIHWTNQSQNCYADAHVKMKLSSDEWYIIQNTQGRHVGVSQLRQELLPSTVLSQFLFKAMHTAFAFTHSRLLETKQICEQLLWIRIFYRISCLHSHTEVDLENSLIWKLHKQANRRGVRSRPISNNIGYPTGIFSHFLHWQSAAVEGLFPTRIHIYLARSGASLDLCIHSCRRQYEGAEMVYGWAHQHIAFTIAEIPRLCTICSWEQLRGTLPAEIGLALPLSYATSKQGLNS